MVGVCKYAQSVRQDRVSGDRGLDSLEHEVGVARGEAEQAELLEREKQEELSQVRGQQERDRPGVERAKAGVGEANALLNQVRGRIFKISLS